MPVALQLFAFDEDPAMLTETMDRWVDAADRCEQSVDFHACVTPHTGETVETARSHPAFSLIETPDGKLSSRNVAHDLAAERGYGVIVTTDADAPPLREDTLVNLLEPLSDPGVVAVNSAPVSFGPTGRIVNLLASFEDYINPHAHGQGMAFRTGAWRSAGPFDESIDQTNINHVRAEEEFGFYRRLRQVGEVVRAHDAPVRNDTRRVSCLIQRSGPGPVKDPFCERAGNTTFQPKRRR